MGELENTIVFFTSDNGPHSEGAHDHLFFNSSGGLRGYKRDLYEGGIREPLLVYWKDKIEPGSVTNRQGTFYDIMPTLAEIAGVEIPDQTDGISILPVLMGKSTLEHEYLYFELQLDGWNRKMPDGGFRQAIRMGKWKGVRYGTASETELYDLENDLHETRNLSAEYPEITKRINQLFMEARTDTEGFPYGGKIQDYKAKERYLERQNSN